MYHAGFFFLPWLWVMNVAYFWPDLRNKEGGDPEIRRHALRSLYGAGFYAVFLGGWTLLYLIGKDRVLSAATYKKLDIASTNLAPYGF